MFLQKPKLIKRTREITSKKELISFVSNQFKQLAKKNLKVPIQLYHL